MIGFGADGRRNDRVIVSSLLPTATLALAIYANRLLIVLVGHCVGGGGGGGGEIENHCGCHVALKGCVCIKLVHIKD